MRKIDAEKIGEGLFKKKDSVKESEDMTKKRRTVAKKQLLDDEKTSESLDQKKPQDKVVEEVVEKPTSIKSQSATVMHVRIKNELLDPEIGIYVSGERYVHKTDFWMQRLLEKEIELI